MTTISDTSTPDPQERFVKQPLKGGWSKVPNGLWTAPGLTHGAALLLGWLWSHEDSYLARLSVRRIGTEFGGGGHIVELLRQLNSTGYITKSRSGQQFVVTLLAEPWEALAVRKPNTPKRSETERDRADYRTVTAPVSEHREDQGLEEQLEHHPPRKSADTPKPEPTRKPPRKRGAVDEAFEAWWKLYPKKKAGKGQARDRWRKMTGAERVDAINAIREHAAWWISHDTDEQFIPAGNVWLNQRRWEDEEPRSATVLSAVPANDWVSRSKARMAAYTPGNQTGSGT